MKYILKNIAAGLYRIRGILVDLPRSGIFIIGFFMEEMWKDIPGYEGFYKVSTHGKVMSYGRHRNAPQSGGRRYVEGRILKINYTRLGYCLVQLSNDKTKKKPHSIHLSLIHI